MRPIPRHAIPSVSSVSSVLKGCVLPTQVQQDVNVTIPSQEYMSIVNELDTLKAFIYKREQHQRSGSEMEKTPRHRTKPHTDRHERTSSDESHVSLVSPSRSSSGKKKLMSVSARNLVKKSKVVEITSESESEMSPVRKRKKVSSQKSTNVASASNAEYCEASAHEAASSLDSSVEHDEDVLSKRKAGRPCNDKIAEYESEDSDNAPVDPKQRKLWYGKRRSRRYRRQIRQAKESSIV